MASGEEIWCQGWSEPDAGSDLAGIRSAGPSATAGDDGWLLSGQKTWCQPGRLRRVVLRHLPHRPRGRAPPGPDLLPHRHGRARASPCGPSPRSTARPDSPRSSSTRSSCPTPRCWARSGQGGRSPCPPPGSERGLSLRSPARYTEAAARLIELFDRPRPSRPPVGPTPSPGPTSTPRPTSCTPTGRPPRSADGHAVGPEASCNKIFWSETDLAIHETALALLGPEAELLASDGLAPGAWLDGYLFALAGPIYAGTNEIQRNVVAERLLGLPRG